jgi:nucleoside-diphosphate-sugar epimerase
MRVFVTGATGFVGSAVVQDLLSAGHEVLGLARSDAGAAALARLGVPVQRGELTDTEVLAAAARACDGVIHTAFIHDFSQFQRNCEIDRAAIAAMTAALAGTGKPFVGTSGTALARAGRLITEDDAAAPGDVAGPRAAAEGLVLGAAATGVRASLIRLPPTVHGAGEHGFVPWLIAIAREKGVSSYVGDGSSRWPAVHRADAAPLYRLALERGTAGARYHGVAEEGVPTRAIAELIGRRLNLPVVSVTPEDAAARFGFLGHVFALDCPTSSAATRAALGWTPTGPGLLTDMEAAYFQG